MEVSLEPDGIHCHMVRANEMVKRAKNFISPANVRHNKDQIGRAVIVEQMQKKDWSKEQLQRSKESRAENF
jgi:hypothetical protein